MNGKKSASWSFNVGLFGAYTLITMIVTYPAITGLVSPYLIPGNEGDRIYFLWHLWWIKRALLDLGVIPTYTNAIFHPVGGLLVLQSPFNELISLTFQPWLGLTRTYTLLVLSSFPMTGFTTYLLGLFLTRNRWAAFIAGLIFSFSAYHYTHTMGHLGLWTIQWLPLYALALLVLLKRPNPKTMTLAVISFLLAVMSDHVYYVFYFVLPMTGAVVIYALYRGQLTWRRRQFWLAFSGALFIGGLLISPIYLHLIQNRDSNFIRKSAVVPFSADLLAYFIPARPHPVWHEAVEPLYKNISNNDNESGLFIGYACTLLIILALIRSPHRRSTSFWLWLGGVALIFSLGPLLNIRGLVELNIKAENIQSYVALPYALLLDLPFIGLLRVPARLAVTVQLAAAILAAYGVDLFIKRRPGVGRIGGYTLLSAFILFETLYYFPYPVDQTLLMPPPIYEQIAQEDNQLAVLEIPARQFKEKEGRVLHMEVASKGYIYQYMYYATIHKHPLVGGESARTPPFPGYLLDTTPFIRELMYPASIADDSPDIMAADIEEIIQRGPEYLAQYNIGYVLVHRDLLDRYIAEADQSLLERILQQTLGTPFYDDDNIVGFRVPLNDQALLLENVEQVEHEALVLGDGWYAKGANFYDRPVRWMGQAGSLLIYAPEATTKRLSLTAFSPMSTYITATLSLNDSTSQVLQIAPTPGEPETHLTYAFPVAAAGLNEIELSIEPAGVPVEILDDRAFLGAYQLALLPTLTLADVAPTHPQQINLADQVYFIGHDQSAQTLQAGETFFLTLYWQAASRMTESYKVFVHLIDPNGNRAFQQDKIPQDWALPTTAWGQEEVVLDPYQFALPADLSPGSYQIQIGMYSTQTGQRLLILPTDEADATTEAISLGTIVIEKHP